MRAEASANTGSPDDWSFSAWLLPPSSPQSHSHVVQSARPDRHRFLASAGGIRDIPDVWDVRTHTAKGDMVSLNDIEHKFLRKEFDEPRIHMALVCAALSCPPLRNEPYSPSTLRRFKPFVMKRNLRFERLQNGLVSGAFKQITVPSTGLIWLPYQRKSVIRMPTGQRWTSLGMVMRM